MATRRPTGGLAPGLGLGCSSGRWQGHPSCGALLPPQRLALLMVAVVAALLLALPAGHAQGAWGGEGLRYVECVKCVEGWEAGQVLCVWGGVLVRELDAVHSNCCKKGVACKSAGSGSQSVTHTLGGSKLCGA